MVAVTAQHKEKDKKQPKLKHENKNNYTLLGLWGEKIQIKKYIKTYTCTERQKAYRNVGDLYMASLYRKRK